MRAKMPRMPTLVLGRAADAEVLLRAIESGAVSKIRPVGILSPSRADRGQAIRGVPVLGEFDDLERVVADLGGRGISVTRLILTPTALAPEAEPEAIADARAPAWDSRPAGCRRSTRAARRCGSRRSMSKICCCGRA